MSADLFLIGPPAKRAPTGLAEALPVDATPQNMGFKAYNLLRMAQLGLPVPPAFVLGTAWCNRGGATVDTWQPALTQLEQLTGRRLGDARRPLLLSVRSGAPVSMPGMMETLLNIGLCDATVPGVLRLTGNPRLVWDAYRRLVATHGEVVRGISGEVFESIIHNAAQGRDERDLDFSELRDVTRQYLAAYEQACGQPFPQDPVVQLQSAIDAVFASWGADKAVTYRHMHNIDAHIGTAVTVQSMVFGNAGGVSGAGVGFTRDPVSGDPQLWVDFLFNAQGEDVVSGRRSAHGHDALSRVMPTVWDELKQAAHTLEAALGDMQDIEFTVEDGHLFMLQTRTGKRSPLAAARIALDLADEGVITPEVARDRTASLTPEQLTCVRVVSEDGQTLQPIGQAASASAGVAIGEIVFDTEQARARHAAGATVILVRRDAETSDLAALDLAAGLLTQRGARTSHAAVVARQMGKVCLVGCATATVDESARTLTLGEVVLTEGDTLTLDGHEGFIYQGAARTRLEEPTELLARLARLPATAVKPA